jgi:hypothetical protein
MRSKDVLSLGQLHRVRASRLVTLERDLQEKTAVLREIENEADACRTELSLVRSQRDAWENEWQSWLRTNGVLSRGEDYSRYHVALIAWDRDVREQLLEIEARQRVASGVVDSARAVVRKAQAKLAALGERLELTRHSIANAQSLRRHREAEELATIAARQVRAARSTDFASDGV